MDRPEFLFGVDMNHNFWVDLYENDTEPDYPYRRDQAGFNVYGGVGLGRYWQLKAGALREAQISADRKNHSTYVQVGYERVWPRWGRVRLFEMSQLVADDIPNPLLQWRPDNTLRGGQLVHLDDPLLARDTWINQLFVGHILTGEKLPGDEQAQLGAFPAVDERESAPTARFGSVGLFLWLDQQGELPLRLAGRDCGAALEERVGATEPVAV